MQILQTLGALRKKATSRDIAGQTIQFFPVRVGKILSGEVRELLTPLIGAITVIMDSSRAHDYEVLEEVAPDGTIARGTKPVSPEMARYRAEKREKAFKDAMDVVLSDKGRIRLGRLLMDSLRGQCPANPSDEQVLEFIDHENMSVEIISEFIRGFVAANTALFGDLGNLIREKVEEMMKPSQPSPEESIDSQDDPDQISADTADEESRVPSK